MQECVTVDAAAHKLAAPGTAQIIGGEFEPGQQPAFLWVLASVVAVVWFLVFVVVVVVLLFSLHWVHHLLGVVGWLAVIANGHVVGLDWLAVVMG